METNDSQKIVKFNGISLKSFSLESQIFFLKIKLGDFQKKSKKCCSILKAMHKSKDTKDQPKAVINSSFYPPPPRPPTTFFRKVQFRNST